MKPTDVVRNLVKDNPNDMMLAKLLDNTYENLTNRWLVNIQDYVQLLRIKRVRTDYIEWSR